VEIVRLENYTFCYPGEEKPVLCDINLTVNQGDFVTVCGKSGSGKTTLLKCLKPEIAPHGKKSGRITFCGQEVGELSEMNGGSIGFVMQNPDNQIVTDTVWHELSFGLENMGMEEAEMRIRVAEIAAFFGIEKWFHKSTSDLSGGQKQILNLAAVMVMEPELLILDEPTSQLDPISAGEFFSTLSKINLEIGTTIILSEHRTEEIFPVTKRVIIMDGGEIIADSTPDEVGKILKKTENDMLLAMPASVRIYEELNGTGKCPVNISEARTWLKEYTENNEVCAVYLKRKEKKKTNGTWVSVKDLYYKYEKNQPYVLKGLSLEVRKGEIYGILGGNGSGKTTLLHLIAGVIKMQSGRRIVGKKVGMLPQNPECLFIKNTVLSDLLDVAEESEVNKVLDLCKIAHLKERHPYDLSGGEQQKLGLCKVLLTNPEVVLLDEPTKGLDAHFKREFAEILMALQEKDVSVIMVSHDIEFCAMVCDRCGMIFDGQIVSSGVPEEFFGGKKFYTTQTARIFKGFSDRIILAEDAIDILRYLGEKK